MSHSPRECRGSSGIRGDLPGPVGAHPVAAGGNALSAMRLDTNERLLYIGLLCVYKDVTSIPAAGVGGILSDPDP